MSDTLPRNSYSRYPALWLAVYFAAGIAIGEFLSLSIWEPILFVGLLLAGCVVNRRSAFLFVPLLFVPLGSFCLEIQTRSVRPDRIKSIYSDGRIQSGSPVEIEGVLSGLPEPAFGGSFIRIRTERIIVKNVERPASGDVRLFVPVVDHHEDADLRYGSRVRVMCRLEREERYRNPGIASRLKTLDEQGIDATASLKSPLLIEKLGDEPIFLPLAWIYERRQRLITAFRENFSDRTAGVMIASLLGDKHFLDGHTADVFRDGGTFHVLVISGLHITFIGGLTLWLVSLFTKRRSWQFTISAAFLWAYTFAVGAEVPVVRASLMFSILLLAHVIYRTSSLLNALGTCTLILLIWRPSDLFSASFQLTLVSVVAIVGCAFPLVEKLRSIGKWMPTVSTPLPPTTSKPLRRFCELLYWNEVDWPIENSRHIWSANLFKSPYLKWFTAPNLRSVVAYIFEAVLVSIVVQIWMLPLLIVYFHRVSPVSVLLNLWVGVFLALESFAAIAAVLVNAVSSWLAAPLIVITEFLNSAMMSIPSWLSADGLAGFRVPVYSGSMRAAYAIFAVSVVFASAGLFQWDPFRSIKLYMRVFTLVSIALMCSLGAVLVFHPYSAPGPTGKLRIDFLDVGQGDSALITFPDGKTMLVDGGGLVRFSNDDETTFEPDTPRIGEAVVSEFLWEQGYSRIDYVIATHADADHMQGLSDVARNFEIANLFVGTTPVDDREFAELLRVVEKKKIPMTFVARGDRLPVGDAEVRVMNPMPNEGAPRGSANDASVVVRVDYGSTSFLLTGDIENRTETDLVINESSDLRAEVVKVPHHGSRTSSSSAFVEATKPETAIISVGRRSRFGHPHPEVVERWLNSGARVMTTGENGTITVISAGENIDIRTFVP